MDICEGKRRVVLPLTMSGQAFSSWKKERGGILHRDLFDYLKGNKHGKYILMEGNEEKLILRLIEDDEISLFEKLRLIDGRVKDKPYMKLMDLSKLLDESNKYGYIEEINLKSFSESGEDDEEDEPMILKPNYIPLEDEEASSDRSLSLFDD